MKLFLLCLISLLLLTGCTAAESGLLAAPEAPKTPQYPQQPDAFYGAADRNAYDAWYSDVFARMDITGYEEALAPFLRATTPVLISGSDTQNRVYSPLSLYTALAMLAESTGGQTHEQIMTLLGADDLPALRQTVDALWNANYRNDGTVTRTLAASVWLNENVPYRQATIETLAGIHHASSYRVRMGSPEGNAALLRWLNKNTMNLLTEQTAGLTMPPETIMALASTAAFSARWEVEFDPDRTAEDIFHAPTGDTPRLYLRADRRDTLWWGERFQAVALPFDMYGGEMWIILPDKGITPDELLTDPDCLALLTGQGCANSRQMLIHLSLPRFDVTSRLELSSHLQALGVTDVFDFDADFTPLTGANTLIALSRVQHDARVVIDEEGCKAAAYTVMLMAGAAPPQELAETEFTVDRPFLFVITGAGGLPLFAGVVNDP